MEFVTHDVFHYYELIVEKIRSCKFTFLNLLDSLCQRLVYCTKQKDALSCVNISLKEQCIWQKLNIISKSIFSSINWQQESCFCCLLYKYTLGTLLHKVHNVVPSCFYSCPFVSFATIEGSPRRLEWEGWGEGQGVCCNQQLDATKSYTLSLERIKLMLFYIFLLWSIAMKRQKPICSPILPNIRTLSVAVCLANGYFLRCNSLKLHGFVLATQDQQDKHWTKQWHAVT